MKCRESPRGKRRERIAYGRVELHDVDNDITRISLANVLSCSCPVKSLIAVGRRDPKRIRCGFTFCSSRLKMLAGIGKILVEFVLFSFRHCLSACSNKSLRVQRPQVSANTSSTVECFVCRTSTYYNSNNSGLNSCTTFTTFFGMDFYRIRSDLEVDPFSHEAMFA